MSRKIIQKWRMPSPIVYEAVSNQLAGFFPFWVNTEPPYYGAPLGYHLVTGNPFCCDPIAWFEEWRYIKNPSAFVLGLPGYGKSTLVRHMITMMAARGINPLILGDLKPDYIDLILALDGQVIQLGTAKNTLNILDIAVQRDAASQLDEEAGTSVLLSAMSRRVSMVENLLKLTRNEDRLTAVERAILPQLCLEADKAAAPQEPTMATIIQILNNPPPGIYEAAALKDKDESLHAILQYLKISFRYLQSDSPLGTIFGGETTIAMELGKPTVFDISHIGNDAIVQAAVLLSVWNYGIGMVETAKALSNAGRIQSNKYFIVMDELWRALRVGHGMVGFLDSLTRLNRQLQVGQMMITHTMSDLKAIKNEEDRQQAEGFLERAGIAFIGPLPQEEMAKLASLNLTEAEKGLLVSWQTAGDAFSEASAAGLGKFICKIPGQHGIPFQTMLTDFEKAVNDTNVGWEIDDA